MAALLGSIAAHAILGVLLAALVWGVGAGCVAALRRGEPLDAYPLGLLVVIAAAALVLVNGWLAPVAVVLVAAPLAFAPRAFRRASGATALWALAPALGLGVVLGLLWHGPSEELESRAFGDSLYYVAKLVSASQEIVPFRELLAEGERVIYLEAAPSFVGAALTHLPGLDPLLLHATTYPVFLAASLAFGLAVAVRGRPHAISIHDALPLALLTAAAVAYPTWITESPPMAFALPLAFSVYGLWAAPRSTAWTLVIGAVVVVDLLLTKVLGVVPIAVVGGAILYARFGAGLPLRTQLVRVGAPLAAAAAAGIGLLFLGAGWYAALYEPKFLPADALRGLWTQRDGLDPQSVAPALVVAGQLLLLAALARARAFVLLFALAAATLGDWVGGRYGFDVAVGFALVLAVLFFADAPERLAAARLPLLGAAVAFGLASWLRELAGLRVGVALVLLVAAVAFAALARDALEAREATALGALTAAVSVLALAGVPALAVVALGAATLRRGAMLAVTVLAAVVAVAAFAVRGDVTLSAAGVTLSPDDYDIWHRVHERVEPSALVFTHFTGYPIDHHHGWNNYAGIAGRQLYVAGWYDTELRAHPRELARRLALNRQVMAGRLAPDDVQLDRRYDAFYAVDWRTTPPPPSFTRLYANASFALYRIEP